MTNEGERRGWAVPNTSVQKQGSIAEEELGFIHAKGGFT